MTGLRPLIWAVAVLAAALVACQEMPPPTPTIPPAPEIAAVATTPPLAAYPLATPLPAYPGGEEGNPPSLPPSPTADTAYPAVTPTTPGPITPPGAGGSQVFVPFLSVAPSSTLSITASLPLPTAPPPPPTDTPTPIPTADFAAVRAELAAAGQDLGYVKIGFHTAVGGNADGLIEWMQQLDAAGVPFFLKSVDNAQPLYIAQEMMKQSGVPHTLVFRRATGQVYDVPNYDLPPDQSAIEHWQRHKEIWPPELDPSLVWFETINEVDKNRAEWLGQFALKTAELALADGYKWAAFGWSSGEPEPEHWQTPSMLQFLRLVAQHPDRLAIALHEYSYLTEDIADAYPYKVGRFQELFRICDQYGIPRPTVLITEWGWTYQHVPTPDKAMRDIAWASRLYAPYPQIKGAAIWYLGTGFGDVADEAQQLIYPMLVYSLQNYFAVPRPPNHAPINPEQYRP